jgi:ribA/ribD-fused uncharacterized protein
MKYSLDQLKQAAARGDKLEFMFFWGHQPGPGGKIGPSCLSQWWEAPFSVDGQSYRSAEYFMMAEKARLFGDMESRAAILVAPDSRAAKELGRKVSGFQNELWLAHRYPIVLAGSVAKFGQNPELLAFLQKTGEQILVEASPVDRIWGIGLGQEDPRARDPQVWQGLNLLGFALMEAREILAGNVDPASAR